MTELPPQAFAPVVVEQEPIRCDECRRLLAEQVTAPWRIKCPRCGALNWATADGQRHSDEPTKRPKRTEGATNGQP